MNSNIENKHEKYKELKRKNKDSFDSLTAEILRYGVEYEYSFVFKDTEDDYKVYLDRKDGKRKLIFNSFIYRYIVNNEEDDERDDYRIVIVSVDEKKSRFDLCFNDDRKVKEKEIKRSFLFLIGSEFFYELIIDFLMRGKD